MLAKLHSFGLNGINGYAVEVETDINNGMPAFETVGLPDAAIKESRERIRSALKNSFFTYPTTRITVNLAPADTKKIGAMYDLPIAVCIMAASEQIHFSLVKDYCFLGELSLDGRVRRVNGILPVLIAAKAQGFTKIIIPADNQKEAGFLEGLQIYGVESLREAVEFLRGEKKLPPVAHEDLSSYLSGGGCAGDFSLVKGQYKAKRALEIAAAGGHNILLIGPPGAGKTMLAKALPGILPDLTPEEALETTKIHSVAGRLDKDTGIVRMRPFRSPHHTATMVALTGGGNSAKPGEISLAHNGVLYLDELPEYDKHVLETLRQPLEDGVISIARATKSVEYPASFMMVASMNPCPCGYYGSSKSECKCSPSQINKYLSKLSGPLLDRIDLHVEVEAVEYDDLHGKAECESSKLIKERVSLARDRQTVRFRGSAAHSNSKMDAGQVSRYCALDGEAEALLRKAFALLKLSARAYNRILKVARTIADLEASPDISALHIGEAIQYRSLDKKYTL